MLDGEEAEPVENRTGKSYLARKALFAKGLREGRLSVQEIEEALPPGTLTAAERWLLYYSLRAARVAIIDEVTGQVDPGFGPAEPPAAAPEPEQPAAPER
jgi:hypothetical protein